MKNLIIILILAMTTFSFAVEKLNIRIKDVTRIQGTKDYFLTGYGIVAGLGGTGDSDGELIQHTLNNSLKNFNIEVSESQLKASNLAAVLITCRIREGVHKNDMVSCTISTLGDATSLLGGTLMLSPVYGTDGEIWGVAQGELVVGGGVFGEGGEGGDVVTKNVPTSAKILDGLQVQRDIGNGEFLKKSEITFVLREPDFSSTQSMTNVINESFVGAAIAAGKGRVRVKIPQSFAEQGKVVDFISRIQQLKFQIDRVARIVMNEKTGTIVVGGEVKISEVAISHGNINVNVRSLTKVSQALPDAPGGETIKYDQKTTNVDEEKALLNYIPAIGNVADLVESLNKLGVTPRDMMSIFDALRASGALHAEVVSQ